MSYRKVVTLPLAHWKRSQCPPPQNTASYRRRGDHKNGGFMKLESCRNLTGDEIETTITMAGNGANGFRVYTTSNSMLTKIGKLLDAPDTAWKLEKVERYSDGVPSGYFFTCSARNCLQLKAKKAAGREMTEEEKEALVQRFAASRAEKMS